MDEAQTKQVRQKVIGVISELAAAQGSPWVHLAHLSGPLAKAGVDYKVLGFGRMRSFLESLGPQLEIKEEHPQDKAPVCYVRTCIGQMPSVAASAQAGTAVAQKIEEKERERLSAIILGILHDQRSTYGTDWVDLVHIGAPLAAKGVNYKTYGFGRLRTFLDQFKDILELTTSQQEDKPASYARPLPGVAVPPMPAPAPEQTAHVPVADARPQPVPTAAAATAVSDPKAMEEPAPKADAPAPLPLDDAHKKMLGEQILEAIGALQAGQTDPWVGLAQLGASLAASGMDYKAYGHEKLRPFLGEFGDILQFTERQPLGKSPVSYVCPRGSVGTAPSVASSPAAVPTHVTAPAPNAVSAPAAVPMASASTICTTSPAHTTTHVRPGAPASTQHEGSGVGERVPNEDTWLFSWASNITPQLSDLVDLALEEKWCYGEPKDENDLPILRNYLAYTFKRLSYEKKIMFRTDPERDEEYAAFNTGLVDRKYEYIYALFKKNTRYPRPYWYLLAFVVPGEDKGKTLVSLFNPLPERANYFENKIENMLYDTTTGELSCDYVHIILERTYRLPMEFLEDNCPQSFLTIDGVTLEEVYHGPNDERKRTYFAKLAEQIKNDTRILNRLKNRIEDAVDLALKRVEWNYKTAIPMYFPKRQRGSLLLPLALVDEEHVDLALVVERQISGSYQGQTILPLDMAYTNSRLVTRPDSDWLKTDLIGNGSDEDLEDE